MLRKFLIVLALVVALVMTFSLLSTGPPIFAVIPLAVVTIAHPIIKYVLKMKAPTPKLLCGFLGTVCTLLVSPVSELGRSVFTQISHLHYYVSGFCPFIFAWVAGSRFLTTQLNC